VWAVAERIAIGIQFHLQPRTQSSPQRSSLLGGDFQSGTTSTMRLGQLSPHQLAVPSKDRWAVTMNEAHRSRESGVLRAAARNARSRSRSSGRRTVRRRTCWWRRTAFSTSSRRTVRPLPRGTIRRTRRR
jgi:hypothetical protein